ncbi:MAG: hypothetical protein U0Y82_11365 [Thermoleophilia bacterium]
MRARYTSVAATTGARCPPMATMMPVSPSSTTPSPPGVMGMALMMRMNDQAANTSMAVTSEPSTPTARTAASSTRYTVMCPAMVVMVRCGQRLRTRARVWVRNDTTSSPQWGCRGRRTNAVIQATARPAVAPIHQALRSRASSATNAPIMAARMSEPITAATTSWWGAPPWKASSTTAATGNATFTIWFQAPVTTTPRVADWAGTSQLFSMANCVPMPTTSPPGSTVDAAVAAWVITMARRKLSPGTAAIHGGGKVRRFNTAAPISHASDVGDI